MAAEEGLDDSHSVGGERARLVGADGRRVAHRLAGVQVSHQIVVAHHFLYQSSHFLLLLFLLDVYISLCLFGFYSPIKFHVRVWVLIELRGSKSKKAKGLIDLMDLKTD